MLDKPPVEVPDEKRFFAIVKAAFAQRRKTLANALSASTELNWSKERAHQLLADASLDPNVRGEMLTLDEFARLTSLSRK